MATCPVQWRTEQEGGDPRTDHAIKGTTRTLGFRRDSFLTATRVQEVLSKQRWWRHRTKGRGPHDPSVRRDPRTLASRRHSTLRWLSRQLLVLYGCLGRHV